ncbi:hypothetical protein BD311DRAFT_682810 [Dichomitus squalens]|uniref:Chromo domain-containing protein n=1 Tax=Dichomitus squalens TaxID=114155 RepID=A0A4Q9N455_9APHY|nr:hypothetical protein BD311DRAFT_682810 [Dichomitus squalens]
MPDAEYDTSPDVEPTQTQFDPDGEGDLWEVEKILAEKGNKYLVKWAGTDNTGKPWPNSWVFKKDTTDDLIQDWKRKKEENKRKKTVATKTRGSSTSSKTTKRAASTSTTSTTRRTRQSVVGASTSPLKPRPLPKVPSSRASPASVRDESPSPHKRRRNTRGSLGAGLESPEAELSRPRKKRKLEIEVMQPPPRYSSEDEEEAGTVLEEDEDDEDDESTGRVVPITKVGPPRDVKRRRKTQATVHTSPHPDRDSPDLPVRRKPSPPAKRYHAPNSQSHRNGEPSSSRLPNGTKKPANAPSKASSSRAAAESMNAAGPGPSHLFLQTRQLLMQEDEENTQEALGILHPVVQQNLSQSPRVSPPRQRAYSAEPEPEPDGEPRPIRSNTVQGHGQPIANDTFSRLGIVPETQAMEAQDTLDEPPYDPTQQDLTSELSVLRTPPRRSDGPLSHPGSVPSVVSKMKSKRKGKSKELHPIPRLSPSDFRPYLQQEEEDIDQFSSPEKDARRTQRVAQPLTQDTIEEDFSQDIDNFMDWEGGAQPHEDPSASLHENGPELSLGPELTPPDAQSGPRKAMEQLLSKEKLRSNALISPEVSALQELPPTSTTQQAEADSMSQQPSMRSSQIAELNAILEEKDEKLTQLERQIEELQARISELESENAAGRTSFETELEVLRAESGEKSEQIGLLESQLVELQLQLTQLTADNENQRAQHEVQIRELAESLEERNEQVAQLEGALVELQEEVEAIGAEKEKLEAVQQSTTRESDANREDELAALQQGLATLQEELSSARQRHNQTVTALSDRLQQTIQECERRVKRAEDDRDLFKKLYDEASTHAQRLAKENIELEEGRQRAEDRAQAGVAMVRATFSEQAKALQSEIEQLRVLNKILTDKDERTNDEVRARAAREPELQEENVKLRVEYQDMKREMQKMSAIIAQMSSIEAREDRRGGDETDEDEDYVPDSDGEGSTTSSGSESGSSSSDSHGRALSVRVRESLSCAPSPGGELLSVCQYVTGEVMCNKTFATFQECINHANDVHYPDVEMLDL